MEYRAFQWIWSYLMLFQLMEIAKAFGPLKAYHFRMNSDINEPCAFLEVLSDYWIHLSYIKLSVLFFSEMFFPYGKGSFYATSGVLILAKIIFRWSELLEVPSGRKNEQIIILLEVRSYASSTIFFGWKSEWTKSSSFYMFKKLVVLSACFSFYLAKQNDLPLLACKGMLSSLNSFFYFNFCLLILLLCFSKGRTSK